jgi:D-alanyl-lipoteichoic acid acyltransferase DltB (MBOAT superfamily)
MILGQDIFQHIIQFFVYDPKNPFIFTEIGFWVFFALALGVDSFLHRNRSMRHAFLFVASIFFYYKTTGIFFLLLLFTACWDFFVGKVIYRTRHKSKRKTWLAVSVVMNLSVLFYFKYAYFFTDIYNASMGTHGQVFNWLAHWSNGFFGTHFMVDKIILPIGISFFTFQSISYTVEVYRGVLKPVKKFTDFAFFVTFFPQLVAGPIVRATDFIPQLYKPYSLSKHEWGLAVFWILNGLVKKILLADYIAVNFIDRIFAKPDAYTGFENLMAIYGYSLQVYADFSGYTDMAIGVALLMGFHLTRNFDSPYKAVNVSDFWRRWHMSLSNWLRDYLYIPLGGNKGGSIGSVVALILIVLVVFALSQSWLVLAGCAFGIGACVIAAQIFTPFAAWITTNLNLMITMIAGGLWHGASWNFMIWGALNGFALVFYKLWKRISPWENKKHIWFVRAWAIFLTFSFITLTRVWFRAGSNTSWEGLNEEHNILDELLSATAMLERIFLHMDWSVAPNVLWSYGHVFLVVLFGMVVHWLPSTLKEKYRSGFAALPIWMIGIVCFVAIFSVYQIMSADLHPFIYFQF